MSTKTGNWLLAAMIPFLLGLVYLIETLTPQVTVTHIESTALQEFFGGRTVVHITDLHIHDLGRLEQAVLDDIEDLAPDLVFITGDFLDDGSGIDAVGEFLRRLRETAAVIAVPGNNDYCCLDTLRAVCAATGTHLLENRTLLLTGGSDSLYVVGVGENTRWRDNYYLAAKTIPAGARRIVLAHAPAIVEMIDSTGVELVLSGHLHGGQVVLPFYGPLFTNRVGYASRVYLAGAYRVNGMNLFSNRGIGSSVLPVRLLARPEIAVLVFDESSAESAGGGYNKTDGER